MNRTICIHHSVDQDGWSSAAIVKHKYPNTEFIGFDHGHPIPKVPANSNVIMCDVALPMENMQQIADISESFTWIDHHISSINTYKEYCKTTECDWIVELPKGDENISACELTWRHFYGGIPPTAIQLLGTYDTFRHKGTEDEDKVLYFQKIANERVDSPKKAKIYLHLSDKTIEEWLGSGKIIKEKEDKEAVGKYQQGKEVMIDGYKFILFSEDRFNPSNHNIDYHKDGFDGCGSYYKDNGGIWHLSLYNEDDKIDCSVICKKFGGGGHKKASGCQPTEEMLGDILNNKYAQPFDSLETE